MKKAPLKYRFLAFIVDFIVLAAVSCFVLYLFGAFGILKALIRNEPTAVIQTNDGANHVNVADFVQIFFAGIIVEILIAGYLTLVPSLLKGQTFGMYLFKIRIVSFDCTKAPFGSIFVRQTLCMTMLPILTFGISLIADFFVILYRRDRLSLSDVISRCRIVDKLDY